MTGAATQALRTAKVVASDGKVAPGVGGKVQPRHQQSQQQKAAPKGKKKGTKKKAKKKR